jgi:hypothetical protein
MPTFLDHFSVATDSPQDNKLYSVTYVQQKNWQLKYRRFPIVILPSFVIEKQNK